MAFRVFQTRHIWHRLTNFKERFVGITVYHLYFPIAVLISPEAHLFSPPIDFWMFFFSSSLKSQNSHSTSPAEHDHVRERQWAEKRKRRPREGSRWREKVLYRVNYACKYMHASKCTYVHMYVCKLCLLVTSRARWVRVSWSQNREPISGRWMLNSKQSTRGTRTNIGLRYSYTELGVPGWPWGRHLKPWPSPQTRTLVFAQQHLEGPCSLGPQAGSPMGPHGGPASAFAAPVRSVLQEDVHPGSTGQ